MDTKLKNYKYSAWFKFMAILLCIAGMLTLAWGLLKAPYFEYAFQNTDFKNSSYCRQLFYNTYDNISYISFLYKNEENIKAGGALNDVFDSRKASLINDKQNELQVIENNYNEAIVQNLQEDTASSEITREEDFHVDSPAETKTQKAPTQEVTPDGSTEQGTKQQKLDQLKEQRDNKINELNEKYNALIENARTDCINDQLADYRSKIAYLNSDKGIYYTVLENGNPVLSNTGSNSSLEAYYTGLPHYVKVTNDDPNGYYGGYHPSFDSSSKNFEVYMGLSQERYNTELSTFNQHMKDGLWGIKISVSGILAFILGLVYLIYAAGRHVDKEGVHLIAADNVYLDVALVLSVCSIVLCMAQLYHFGEYIFSGRSNLNNDLVYIIIGVLISIGTLIGILYVIMFTKRLKRKEVIQHTLIYKVSTWIMRNLKIFFTKLCLKIGSVYDKSPLAMRLVLIFGGYSLAVIISILLFFAGPAGVMIGFVCLAGINVTAVYFVLKTFKIFRNIKDGAERIRSGELSYNIPLPGIPEFAGLSETINKIADGLKNAVDSQVKAEHMKAELITNVSHDLKTPLTSIITYVDLLKNEGLKSENAEKYLEIIDKKSQRLKSLTEDLFEAAKANSGNIAVNFEKLNVASLINQGMGELSDKIEASGLIFKINMQPERLYVNADGKLLWRVIENLLSNVFKYALPGSRVYLEAFEGSGQVNIIIKNISAYELNIDASELMERFKRGDASRHSEGSGLGLSIAKSLTELQGGKFTLEIDGDLFKATVALPQCTN